MRRILPLAIAVLLLAGCASAEERAAQEAAEALEMREDMWSAMGNEGPLPDISEEGVAANVSDLFDTTTDIMVNGSTPAACEALGTAWDLLSQTAMADAEQQGYLNVMLDDLSQGYSSCGDGRWKDTMPRVININLMTEQYLERY